jgi:hypothetical protein
MPTEIIGVMAEEKAPTYRKSEPGTVYTIEFEHLGEV